MPAIRRFTRKNDRGRWFTYHGHDGKAYAAQCADVHRGVVVIDYRASNGMVRAYIDKCSYDRLQGHDALHGGGRS